MELAVRAKTQENSRREKEKSCSGSGQTCLSGHVFFPALMECAFLGALLLRSQAAPVGPFPSFSQLHILLSSELVFAV